MRFKILDFRTGKKAHYLGNNTIIVPDSLQDRVLHQLHNSHPGIAWMKGIARSHVWWPDLDQNIEYIVKGCQKCQLQQATLGAATVHPLIWSQVPWYRLHIDYCGPFLGYMWLVMVDATTKWVEIIPVKETNSAQTIQALNTIFVRFGWPIQIWSDNGTTFTSEEFCRFCESKRIRHIFSALFHPRSYGEAECMVHTFKSMLKKVNPAKSEVILTVSDMLLTYNSARDDRHVPIRDAL